MFSTNVFAEWTEVSSDGADMTRYVDLGTIKKKGHKVKMWSLNDLKTVQESAGYRYLSSVVRYEYDCEEETTRLLDLHWYSGNMAGGEIVYSHTYVKAEEGSIVPDSISETDFKIACAKK